MTTILTEVNGFTPVIDAIVTDLGGTPALVFGMVWRFCQMESGTCTASVETIANRLNMDRKTAERHIKKLCTAGYLEDTTPDRKHAPHVYRDTGKAQVVGSMQGGAKRTTSSAEVVQNVQRVSQNAPPRSGEIPRPGGAKRTSKIPSKIPLEDRSKDTSSPPTAEIAVPQKILEIQCLTIKEIQRKRLIASEWEQLLEYEQRIGNPPRKGLIDFINRKLANGHLSPGQVQYLALFGATQFKNPTQAKTVADCITAHGLPLVIEVGTWAANKGFSVADSVTRLGTAIKTWKKPPTTNASTTGGRVFV